MTIIVQTGHYSSYSQELMDKLYQRGLNRPLVSFNHQITADKVSESLIKIANKSIGLLDNKLADSLAVDLLLGNLAQSEWGWNHPDNLIAINYWEQLDKDSRFILVFDHPKYLFNRMVDSELTIDLLDEMVQDWIDYHEKLLTTYEQLDKKAILLEGKVAIKNLGNVKTEIQSIAHSLQLKSSWQLPIEKIETKHEEKISKEILINEIIKEYPEMLIVYEKLLQKAKVKTAKSSLYNKQRKLSKLITCLNQERAEQSQQMLALAYQDELQQEHKKLVESNQKVEELNKKLKDAELIKSQLEDAKKLMIQKDKQISDENLAIKKEHELLIAQLYQVQEELEKYYIDNQNLKKKLTDTTARPIYYGAADRVKNDLPYRLGATMVNHSKSTKDLAKLPFALAQEYREFQKQQDTQDKSPPIEEYQDSYEAEKVKKHLSYRLGKTLVDGVKSPKNVLGLPVKLGKEIIGFGKK